MENINSSNKTSKKKKIIIVIIVFFVMAIISNVIQSLVPKNNVDDINSSDIPQDMRPQSQKEFEDKAWSYINAFKEAESNSNDIKEKEIEQSSVNFFRNQIVAEKWVARFSSLTTLGEYSGNYGNDDFHIVWIVSRSGFSYRLRLTRHNENLNNYLANIKKDDIVTFSGIALHNSLTPDRVVHDSEPSYEVNCVKFGDIVIGDIDALKDSYSNLRIGQLHDGGIILRVENGHGLMIAPDDLDQIEGYKHHKPANGSGVFLGTYTWLETMDVLDNFTYNGHNDWRLPTKKEWDLIDQAQDNSTSNLGTFYGTIYWTSDENKDMFGETSEAFIKNLNGDRTYDIGSKDKSSWGYVRFVREF